MSYTSYREGLIEGYYDYQLETLMSGYRPDRSTVLLLPGGMGSQLERTEKPYPASPNVINDVVWLDAGILGKLDALKLEIDMQGKDINSYVIAAHGPVRFLTQTPYDKLEDYAQQQGWNYGVFGFDWRRPLAESAGYFRYFVLAFRDRVINDYGIDPIPNLTILSHSMGGMVCTTALRNDSFSKLGFHAVVTIATPFYGTSTQQDRYFIGVPELNFIYKTKNVVRIVASLPGPYTLLFLPKSIYNRDGAKLGLKRYPEYDPNGNVDADPFDPGLMQRWVPDVRQHRQYLLDAKKEMGNLAAPISANIAPVYFNVRSSLDIATAVELLWNNVDGDDIILGTSPSPLAGVAGPGDGTVPAWSAWHAYCRPANRYELKQANDHGTLLEHQEVLDLVGTIVKTGKLPKASARRRTAPAPAVASKSKVAHALAAWAAKPAKPKRGRPVTPELLESSVQRAILSGLIAGAKPRMTRKPVVAGRRRKKRS